MPGVCYALLYVREDDWGGPGVCYALLYVRKDDWVGLVSAMYYNMSGRMTGCAWCLLCTVICQGG